MKDLPPSDSAGQPCIGPDGHIPPDADAKPLSALIPAFPDMRLIALPAAIGGRCTGLHSTVTHEWGATSEGPHLATIAVGFDPPRPHAPDAFVGGVPGLPGEIVRTGHNGDDLGADDRQQLVDAYQAVIEGRGGPIQLSRRRGKPEGATTYPRDLIRDKLLDSERLRREGLSRAHRAARLGVPEGTLREWEDKRSRNPHYPNPPNKTS
jgi:hypothetical protein